MILDVDAGVDDALAIILAMRSPELEVVAITTVSGNVHVDLCTKNVLRVLTLLGDGERPAVARGEERPLIEDPYSAESVHGDDGLGDLGDDYYPPLDCELISSKSAVELLPEMVASKPGEVTIVATGPLTNVAKAIQVDPAAMAQGKEIIVMGGAVEEQGNVNPLCVAEFNVYVDPDALEVALGFSVPVTLVPLDVTHQVPLLREVARRRLAGSVNQVSRFVFDCAQKYMDSNMKESAMDGAYLHDPLAVGVAIDPSMVTTQQRQIYVETKEGLTRGMTIPYRSPGEEANCRVATSVRAKSFLEMFLNRVEAG